MAAASAGAIQTGFLSGTIASSSSQLQQQELQQQHQSEQSLQHNANLIGSSFVGQQSNYVQRLNYVNVKQHLLNNSPNVAPGWRRQLSEGEIVYFSPSGTALRKIEQIKDYLLRHGTCKCGLPCPLRPDYFFEFNPQVPNSPLQIPPEHASNRSCLQHARFIEQHSLLSKTVVQPTNFNHSLSSSHKLNTVLSAEPISQEAASGQDPVYAEQNDSPENQIESVTVSRTPPWRKNPIINQQQQQQQQQQAVVGPNVENANISHTNSRVPPLPQQHLIQMQTQTQPPWQEEAQKRRNTTKKRPNFKDDPTGYLNHQTAILHNSILSVHSPELQDTDSSSSTSQHAYRQTPLNINNRNNNTIRTSSDTGNLLNNQNIASESGGVSDDLNQQQTSVMQQQQQNQNVYIQQFDSNSISENQMIIGSNGQPVQIVQNTAPVIYSNPSDFTLNSNAPRTQIAQPIGKVGEFIGGKRPQNHLLNTHTVQIQGKHDHQTKQLNPFISQQQPQSQPFPSLGHTSKVVTTQQQTIVTSQTDQDTGATDDRNNPGLPIDVTHLPNGVVQVHHNNCDINQGKSQPQTILVKSNQLARSLSNQQSKNPCILPQKHGILQRIASVSQESPVSSSTTNKSTIVEIQSTINDKEPSQVGTISTSNESPPSSSPDTSASPESSGISDSPTNNQSNKLQTNIYVAGQTSGRNTITSVLAGKAMTSTTTTNQFTFTNDKNRLIDNTSNANLIQIHEHRILRPAQTIQATKQTNNNNNNNNNNSIAQLNTNSGITIKSTNNRTIQSIVQGTTSPPSSQPNLSNIQIQQQPPPQTNQIIMTSSGCQILVMPTQNNKSPSPMIIGQPGNANTLVVSNNSGQQNVVLNPSNAHMIGNELIQGINDSTITHSNIMQNNLIQTANNVITANNTNSNYIVSSPNTMQSMIINNSNLLSHNGNVLQHHHHQQHHHHPGQNVMQGNANSILASANATKVISNAGNLLSSPNILTNQPNVIATNNQFIGSNNSALLSPNNSGIVINQLSNASYVIQPQSFTTVDGQVVNVINSDNGGQFVQQTQQRIVLSPDSKRRVKKRKSTSASPQSDNSPQQSPTIQTPQQPATVLQIAPQYHHQSHQGFQTTIEQQILLQNGQTILQPLNLIGQQLLVPAGLMMTSDTVLQIQNVAPCSLITPQGIVQNKSFLSPNSANQQFIVSGNGQISPIGQMQSVYQTPVGLVVPQSNGPTFVQQSTTIVQQQTTMMNNSNSVNETDLTANIPHSVSTQTTQTNTLHTVTASPPDTTTHSPRSPERPESQRSIASDINMVQFVSSSEPDSVVSPVADSAQSPNTDHDRNTNNSYPMTTLFKPNEAKIRRIQTPTHYANNVNCFKMKPDSHVNESPSPTSQAANASSTSNTPPNVCMNTSTMFSVGELVWGPVRGHTAWPGKVVPAPHNNCTQPNDSMCWVRWFGGKSSIAQVHTSSLKSLSEGLEAHHKAQKDNRKGRKLNSQLEKAIQEAMAELDRIPTTTTTPPSPATQSKKLMIATPVSSKSGRARVTRASTAQQRTKLIKIAPAPPNNKKNLISLYDGTTTLNK